MIAKVKPNTQIIGQNIIYFNQVSSTNSFANELIRQNLAGDGTVIFAEHQLQGRGQSEKTWKSAPFENLLFSVVLFPVTKTETDPFLLNKAIAVSLQNSIQNQFPELKVSIKWPNDIFVNKRKICGILIENNFSGKGLKWSIAGIGINVNQLTDPSELPNACSFRSFRDTDSDRSELFKTILEDLDRHYALFLQGRQTEISTAFDSNLLGYGEDTDFSTADGVVRLRIVGCDREGRLLTENRNGKTEAHIHGSITQIIHA